MSARSIAFGLLLGLGMAGPALAHPQVSGQIVIGDGPLSLGISLGQLLHHGHAHARHHAHAHGPACYRSYANTHPHWGGHYRPQHRHERQAYRNHRGHRGQWKQQVRRHKHRKDCHLHYPRDHAHWH